MGPCNRSELNLVLGGGVTGGSGGGDPSAAAFKTLLLGIGMICIHTCGKQNSIDCHFLLTHRKEIWQELIKLNVEVDTNAKTDCRLECPGRDELGDLLSFLLNIPLATAE